MVWLRRQSLQRFERWRCVVSPLSVVTTDHYFCGDHLSWLDTCLSVQLKY